MNGEAADVIGNIVHAMQVVDELEAREKSA